MLLQKKQTIFLCAGDTAHVVANQEVLSPVKRLLGIAVRQRWGRSDKGGHEPETGVD